MPFERKEFVLEMYVFNFALYNGIGYEFFTGIKFVVIADPRLGSQEPLLKKLYEVYADYALKNPFYSIDMPIR